MDDITQKALIDMAVLYSQSVGKVPGVEAKLDDVRQQLEGGGIDVDAVVAERLSAMQGRGR